MTAVSSTTPDSKEAIAEALESVRHRRLQLTDLETEAADIPSTRSTISVWAGFDDDTGAHVTLHIEPSWGHAARFTDLTPMEARRLATFLIETAGKVERITGGTAAVTA